MKMTRRLFLFFGFTVLGFAFSAKSQVQSVTNEKESARIFVQKFYDWYLVLWAEAQKHPSRSATRELAVSQKPEYFDNALKSALAKDDSAQNKSGDIVGLDFDPFLRCQELYGEYQACDVKRTGGKYFVDIRNIEKGKTEKEIRGAELRVVAGLVKRNGHWIFTNFMYPSKDGKSNLLSMLKDLKNDRDKSSIK